MEYLIFVFFPLIVFLVVILFLIWQMVKMEQMIISLSDFINDKMVEHEQYMEKLNGEIVEIQDYNSRLNEFISSVVLPEFDFVEFKTDLISLDYHRHIAYSYHLNEKNQKIRPTQLLEQEIQLCHLEKSVKERAEKYKTKLNLIRPEGI